MLRIIWILPGGCALLAIVILALSFRTLDRPHSQSMPNVPQARFAVIELGEHPEWRQFLALSADQRANELNRLRELLDIKEANDVASATPKGVAQPTNRSDSDLGDSDVLSMQSPAADTGASTPIQVPIATPDENQAVGIQEDKPGASTLPDDSGASIQKEKPAVSTLEEKPIALGEEPSTKATTDTPIVAAQPANRNNADLDESNALSMQSRAADTGASTPIPVPIATPDENQAVGIQEGKPGASTLPDDSRASVRKEKPAVSALEEKPIALGEEKSTKAMPGKKSTATKPPKRATPRTQSLSKGVQHVRSRARAPSKQKPSPPQYFFEPFGHQQTSQTSTVNTANQQTRQISTPNANNYFGNQRAGQPEMPNFSNY
jgi:hypothetical protein